MKIGFVVANPLLEGLGFSLRPYMLIKYLSLYKDIEIHVYTPFDEVQGKFKNVHFHKLKASFGSTSLEKLLYRISRMMIKRKFFANNLIYRSFILNKIVEGLAQSLIEKLKIYPVDLLQAEQDIVAAAAISAKKFCDIPVVADILDLWADEEVLAGRIKPESHAFNAISNITEKALLESEVILVGNPLLKHILQSRFSLERSKITVSPNGGELLPVNLTKQRKRRVVYAGNFEPYEYVDLFIQAASFILKKDKSVEVSIFGKGPDEKRLRNIAKKCRLPASVFKGFIQREELIPILMESSVGVVPTKKKYATPIKPFEYFSAGLPIVAIKGMWWTEVMERYHAGISSTFEPEEFAEAIFTLINSADFDQYSKGAMEVIKKEYNWYNITENLISVYKKLIC
jgi:glycosyltransferase involved in cell wall biosynthesis